MASGLRRHLTYSNIGVTVALILAVTGFAAAAIPGSHGVISACYSKRSGALRLIDTAKKGRAGHCGRGERGVSFNRRGPVGLTGARGPVGLQGANGSDGQRGAPGATSVQVRVSPAGTANAGARASGVSGGAGGSATCQGAGCLATGGAGGNGGGNGTTGGSGGPGAAGSASCPGATCTGAPGAPGAPGGATAQDGEAGRGGIVGERADCQAGERAVGGGPYVTGGQAAVYRSHPATTSSSAPPDEGATATAWYVEGYNPVAGGPAVSVKAYVVCASP